MEENSEDPLYKWWDDWYENPERRLELLKSLPILKEVKLDDLSYMILKSLFEDLLEYMILREVKYDGN